MLSATVVLLGVVCIVSYWQPCYCKEKIVTVKFGQSCYRKLTLYDPATKLGIQVRGNDGCIDCSSRYLCSGVEKSCTVDVELGSSSLKKTHKVCVDLRSQSVRRCGSKIIAQLGSRPRYGEPLTVKKFCEYNYFSGPRCQHESDSGSFHGNDLSISYKSIDFCDIGGTAYVTLEPKRGVKYSNLRQQPCPKNPSPGYGSHPGYVALTFNPYQDDWNSTEFCTVTLRPRTPYDTPKHYQFCITIEEGKLTSQEGELLLTAEGENLEVSPYLNEQCWDVDESVKVTYVRNVTSKAKVDFLLKYNFNPVYPVEEPDKGLGTGAIVGLIVGACVLFCGALCLCCICRSKSDETSDTTPDAREGRPLQSQSAFELPVSSSHSPEPSAPPFIPPSAPPSAPPLAPPSEGNSAQGAGPVQNAPPPDYFALFPDKA